MPDTLAIRNASPRELTLTVIEYLPLPSKRSKSRNALVDLDRVKPGVCGGTNDGDINVVKRKTSRPVNHVGRSPVTRNVSIQIRPFDINQTPIHAIGSGERLRLIFLDAQHTNYSLDIPTASGRVERFICNGHAQSDLFGTQSKPDLLVIFATVDLASWMQRHADDTPLQALSIPGTHNSATYFRALPSVRCQAVSLREQLQHGVRWLDFRLQVDHPERLDSDQLSVVHSVFPVALSGSKQFRELYNDVLDFLAHHPGETIIMSLKREGTGKGTDADLAKRLHDHYINDTDWVTKPGVPTLGEARGKIVLLRRFQLAKDTASLSQKIHGINAQPWADNSPNSTAGDVQVQDFYEVLHTKNVERKIGYIHDHCGRVATSDVASLSCAPLFINFLSASNFWRPGCWPDKIAAKINPAVTRYLCEQHGLRRGRNEGHGGMGVLVCDWVGAQGDWDLVEMIVGMNEKLLAQ